MSNSKGLVLTVWTDNEPPDWAAAAVENHKAFSARWSYNYRFARVERSELMDTNGKELSLTWAKVLALRAALNESLWDFVFLIDADSIFSDQRIGLDDLGRIGKDLVVTGDPNDLCNTGHLWLKSSGPVREFVEDWWSLRNYVWPVLKTTHQNQETGMVNDQVAFNYLIAGGKPNQHTVSQAGQRLFNRTNGYPKNKDRKFKKFHKWFAPTNSLRTHTARFLLSPRYRSIVGFVPQARLNWYPSSSEVDLSAYPVLHYPGGMKKQLLPDLARLTASLR